MSLNSSLTSRPHKKAKQLRSIFLGRQEGIRRHAEFEKACEHDCVLSVMRQDELDTMLGIAITNMPASGYNVAEFGTGASTKQVGWLVYTALVHARPASMLVQHFGCCRL